MCRRVRAGCPQGVTSSGCRSSAQSNYHITTERRRSVATTPVRSDCDGITRSARKLANNLVVQLNPETGLLIDGEPPVVEVFWRNDQLGSPRHLGVRELVDLTVGQRHAGMASG